MKFRIPNKLSQNILFITRRIGYLRIINSIENQESFVRQLTKNHYPRFHLYITESEKEVIFDLHLDQSQAIYHNQKAHNAEYQSENVKTELTRIFQIVHQFMIQ